MLAKMISTLDHLSKGRVSVNLIAGQNDDDVFAEGVHYAKEERYALMDEEVEILKALWTGRGGLDFEGRFHTLKGAQIRPRSYPAAASEILSRRRLAAGLGDLGQARAACICSGATRPSASPKTSSASARSRRRSWAWRRDRFRHAAADHLPRNGGRSLGAANALVAKTSERDRARVIERTKTSEANMRIQQLAAEKGDHIAPNLWGGLTRVRQGAGIAVVGDPAECAAVLQRFIDIGCHSFCLSGYLHDEEAERFGRLVRPLLAQANPGRMPAIISLSSAAVSRVGSASCGQHSPSSNLYHPSRHWRRAKAATDNRASARVLFVETCGAQSDRAASRAARASLEVEPSGHRLVGLPTLVCMMLATVSFGAARIHAGAITLRQPTAGTTAESTGISIRLVDFKPHAFMPSAFADWTETAETAKK